MEEHRNQEVVDSSDTGYRRCAPHRPNRTSLCSTGSPRHPGSSIDDARVVTRRKCKSLPAILVHVSDRLEKDRKENDEMNRVGQCGESQECASSNQQGSHNQEAPPPVSSCSQDHQHHHHHKPPKILKKTWDKVKTIVINKSSSGSGQRRESLRKGGGAYTPPLGCGKSSSMPTTPLRGYTEHPDNQAFPFCSEVVGVDPELVEGRRDQHVRVDERIARNYAMLQKRLSDEFHKMTDEQQQEPGAGQIGRLEGGGRVVGVHNRLLRSNEQGMSSEFRERLREWEMWKASTGKGKYTDEELREIVSEEFGRKLEEWEVMRSTGTTRPDEQKNNPDQTSGCGSRVGKNSGGSSSSSSSTVESELAWLDKQLEKIEVEKKRLEAEMGKYLEREARLEKMREALRTTRRSGGCETGGYVHTPNACVRVEKITEKFAKKLYEWEERQGIRVEESGFALLSRGEYVVGEDKTGGTSNTRFGNVEEDAEREQHHHQRNNGGAVPNEVVGSEDPEKGELEDSRKEHENEESELVLGPLDLINRRLKEAEENSQETEQEKSVRLAMEHVAEALRDVEQMEEAAAGRCGGEAGGGRASSKVSSTASSCCSADYDDSFATKNTSGATSNTDSDVYKNLRGGGGGVVRRSSDGVSSTPARSPSVSAFTSEEEEENEPEETHNDPTAVPPEATLLRLNRVSEERDTKVCGSTENQKHQYHQQEVRDAESQTEVILKAKQIVVVDSDEDEDGGNGCNEEVCIAGTSVGTYGSVTPRGIFVQTKRTIFSPVIGGGVEDDDDDDVDDDEQAIVEGRGIEDVGARGQGGLAEPPTVTCTEPQVLESCTGESGVLTLTSPVIAAPPAESPRLSKDEQPRVVGAIPKLLCSNFSASDVRPPRSTYYKPQPKTQLNRSFPARIPMWCSPLVSRKNQQPQQHPVGCGSVEDHRSDWGFPGTGDFMTIDRFLEDSKLLVGGVPSGQHEHDMDCGVKSLPPPPPRNVAAGLGRKGGGGSGAVVTPAGAGSSSNVLLTRSNSFGYNKPTRVVMESSNKAFFGGGDVEEDTQYLEDDGDVDDRSGMLHSSCSMHSVSKSKSTGSIKSRFGRAFGRKKLFGGFTIGRKKQDATDRDGLVIRGRENENEREQARNQLLIPGDDCEVREPPPPARDDNDDDTGSVNNRPGGLNPIRRFGSWVYNFGGHGHGGGGN